MDTKERLSNSEYTRAIGLACGLCMSITGGLLSRNHINPLFDPKGSLYIWPAALVAVLLANLLFNPQGRSWGYLTIKSWQEQPRFIKAIFKAKFFGAFYDVLSNSRLRDFYFMLLMMLFIIAMHEISAYFGYPSNALVEALTILGFQGILKLCVKWGW
ncbi:hypothetical protein [Helicobacter cetorum]|uniref:Uncharacterized protein n=1 Tax=Helicobacter cetorum (strain ATCC BAA-540 / CCUG 52418 / MIT 99-5656) TaxID=1163745 RepID=I0EQB5_HELCM|nr:hypothetical protein [Helicobacter cetorum]AFI05134.1 hypothetical protein HCD_00510 [Helicobacter cetorum MIT 99-5656]